MNSLEIIWHYYPKTTPWQKEQIAALWDQYHYWNKKINVISRKDIDELYIRHVLHSLAIKKYLDFPPGSHILDLGTGGGFPGIPLAIIFPNCFFTLVDSKQKKIQVVSAIASALDLGHITAKHIRVEDLKGSYDFVVCRAVAEISILIRWSEPLISWTTQTKTIHGLILLKGGNLDAELKQVPHNYDFKKISLSTYFSESFFEEKYLIHLFKKHLDP